MDQVSESGSRRGQTAKSASAFRTISEVSDELDVPQHVLRFWETKFSQVKPLKRGGGRRYYRPEDLALLRRIRDLLYTEGYTIRGVQRLLRQSGVKAVLQAATEAQDASVDPEETPIQEATVSQGGAVVTAEPGSAPAAATHAQAAPSPPAEMTPADPAETKKLSPETRRELESILEELTALRGMLPGQGGD